MKFYRKIKQTKQDTQETVAANTKAEEDKRKGEVIKTAKNIPGFIRKERKNNDEFKYKKIKERKNYGKK